MSFVSELQFYNTFIIATLLFSFLIVFSVFADSSVIYYSNWHTNKARTIVETFPFIGQHPIYASIFFSLSILFTTDIIKNFNSNGINLKMYYLVIFLNTTLLLFFLSKAKPIIANKIAGPNIIAAKNKTIPS